VKPLGGRFVLLREVGAGGMSRVFLGRDEVLDRPVAVKILNTGHDDTNLGTRFRREGRTAAKLSHPNIVQVYDAGEGEFEGRRVSYIVMEYISGGDLKGIVDRGGALPGAMLTRLGADVAAGLAHAHERGVIHRDIKPRNVLLDENGTPKLTDFGVARALDEGATTTSEAYLGTAAYSSPEQLRGGKVTPKSDIYSLGATLYHAAVGGPPFVGGPLDIATQQTENPLIPPRARGASIGRGFEESILDCLSIDPDERPGAGDLKELLLPSGIVGLAAPQNGGNSNGWSSGPSDDELGGTTNVAGGGATRRSSGRQATASGPPDETIIIPTRTFRSGTRPRTLLAFLTIAVVVLILAGAGAWALLGSNQDEASPPKNSGQEQADGSPKEEAQKLDLKQEPENKGQGDSAGAGSQGGSEEEPAPALPPEKAEQVVFDMYYEESFATPQTSWVFLSEGLQSEIGSVDKWAEQEDIYTFIYMEFLSMPQASITGNEANVAFKVRLDHNWGSEVLSGTWVCVNQDGKWKLDRLEGEQSKTF